MNQDPQNEADALRSDIDVTRRRMDDTMDALSNRLQGRHLIDEVIGFFRGDSKDGDSRMHHMKERISTSANSALHTVVDTVKANPLPTLLIGAGVAWMIYGKRRSETAGDWSESTLSDGLEYDPDLHYDRPIDYPATASSGPLGAGEEQEGKLGHLAHNLGEKASAAKGAAREKMSNMKHQAGEKMHAWRDRAGEMTAEARERAGAAYGQTRERVATTAQEHPLELGLGLLAAGILIGLAIPPLAPVNRFAGPTVDRLRERTRERSREMIEKGKRVARAATDALKEEARAEGLTPQQLREKAGAVAEHSKEAASEAARREGLTGAEATERGSSPKPASSDPSLARPEM